MIGVGGAPAKWATLTFGLLGARLVSVFRDRVETRGQPVTVRGIDELREYPVVDSQTFAT